MTVSKDNQQLRDALVSAAFLLKWSSADLRKSANALIDAGSEAEASALLEIVSNYESSGACLLGFAGEVKAGRIVRARGE
ncbi:hypothetical protein V2J67_22920 [Pseudomonas alliivorans]|nr:hypothetical protein [Pseudomonas alliivorans]